MLVNQGGTFAPPVSYPAAASPNLIAAGDLDGDGKLDLVVASNGGLSLLWNNGDGTFAPGAQYAASFDGIVVADLNHDGKLDVAGTGSRVAVLLNHGDRTLEPAVEYAGGPALFAIAAGDLDGDGHADVVVGDYGNVSSNSVYVLSLGAPLRAAPAYAAGTSPASVVVADLDGDGTLDAVITDSGYAGNSGTKPGGVDVLLGRGGGAFADATAYPIGITVAAGVVGDVDGDGRLDVAVSDVETESVDVLLNRGGPLATPTSYMVSGYARFLAMRDFDGDGWPDIAFAGSGIGVLMNDRHGSFSPGASYPATMWTATSVAAGDLDGDGNLDLVVTHDALVDVWLNNGDGSFAAPRSNVVGLGATSATVGDLDGDGRPEIAVANADAGTVSVLFNLGHGAFAASVDYAVAANPTALVLGDLNADGKAELAVASDGSIDVLVNAGDGTFGPPVTFAAATASSLVLGDVNGDGLADLLLVGRTGCLVLINDSRDVR